MGAKFVPEIDMRVEGVQALQAAFVVFVASVTGKVNAVTRTYGQRLRNDIRSSARSSFVVTDYDASINLHITGGPDRPRAYVSSTDPQSHRLEHGFVGVDSAGRYVAQPPRPHFRPAVDRIRKSYVAAIRGTLK